MSYSPAIGTWLEKDPDGYVDSMDLYEPFSSNPLTNTDPTGLESEFDVQAQMETMNIAKGRSSPPFGHAQLNFNDNQYPNGVEQHLAELQKQHLVPKPA